MSISERYQYFREMGQYQDKVYEKELQKLTDALVGKTIASAKLSGGSFGPTGFELTFTDGTTVDIDSFGDDGEWGIEYESTEGTPDEARAVAIQKAREKFSNPPPEEEPVTLIPPEFSKALFRNLLNNRGILEEPK